MNVKIVFSYGFPHGMASASRVRELGSGLASNGHTVEVLLPYPTENPKRVLNNARVGKSKNIFFCYTAFSTVLSENKFGRVAQKLVGSVRCAKRIARERKTTDAVILYCRNLGIVVFLGILCKILHIRVYLELCEWPETLHSQKLKTRLSRWFFTAYGFFFVDGVIAISTTIKEKVEDFERRYGVRRPTVIIPILVDSGDFTCAKQYSHSGNLVFAGTLDDQRIVLFLFSVVKELKAMGVHRMLSIMGSAMREKDVEHLQRLTVEFEISDVVEFLGYVSFEELKRRYCDALALLAPLPAGARSEARIPTKIGEYLSTGRPLVTTLVGDIPLFLKEGVSAFLTPPGDVKAFADAIRTIVDRPDLALVVGENGRLVAERSFNPSFEGKKLAAYLEKCY